MSDKKSLFNSSDTTVVVNALSTQRAVYQRASRATNDDEMKAVYSRRIGELVRIQSILEGELL